MRCRRRGAVPLLVAGLALAGCSGSSQLPTDASALERAVLRRAEALGSSQVVQLELRDLPDAPDIRVSVLRPDGLIAEARLADKAVAQRQRTTPTEGLPAEQLPYEQFVDGAQQTRENCAAESGGQVVLTSTPTGRPVIVARCLGDGQPIGTILDGQRVNAAQTFGGAEAYDQLLAEARLVYGDELRYFGIHFGTGGADSDLFPYLSVIGPGYEAAGVPCVLLYQRSAKALDYAAECTVADEYELQHLDITGVSGAVLQTAYDKAVEQLGGDATKVAEVDIIGEGTTLQLRVTTPDGTNARQPL